MSDVKCGTRTCGATEHPANRLPRKGDRDRQKAGATVAGGWLELVLHVAAGLTTRRSAPEDRDKKWFRRDLVIWGEQEQLE
ncbi:hypothetical protein SNOG_01209 [Parastagonospora nodorum SN15]|uniref:Uncharacterized protein n=1 Tax=Phaeosphaeria nodorum (strain SN15 / ATCC MYA-4574 / FGSC 10173) TaxID=321614 RepID=Q0V455_PHANO|nr:hypothetical protein SNOG_01209 [Parastagonospora nodorum SN15]EAT90858.1 hypothetical protein SNOG_01209 [Parastagonospora nodorum SN15]